MNKNLLLIALLLISGLMISCGDDDAPPIENEEEVIDLVRLTFSPSGGGTDVVVTATDPDGEGPMNMAPDAVIELNTGTTYTLSIEFENTAEAEDITEEVEQEGEEHMIFFSFTADIFSDPTGDGNIDNRADDINYNDQDMDGNPIGLSTDWTAGSASSDGSFRIVLKHQPNLKSGTSGSTNGETDVDIAWEIDILAP